MVVRVLPGVATGSDCFFDNRLEIPPLRITEQFLQIAGEPKLDAACLVGVGTAFKITVKLMNDLFVHKFDSYFGKFTLSFPRRSIGL